MKPIRGCAEHVCPYEIITRLFFTNEAYEAFGSPNLNPRHVHIWAALPRGFIVVQTCGLPWLSHGVALDKK
jgi:hypothetical protein